jgi:hypothetical protein
VKEKKEKKTTRKDERHEPSSVVSSVPEAVRWTRDSVSSSESSCLAPTAEAAVADRNEEDCFRTEDGLPLRAASDILVNSAETSIESSTSDPPWLPLEPDAFDAPSISISWEGRRYGSFVK